MKNKRNTITIPAGKKYLKDAIDESGQRLTSLPAGRINKQFTGIGATTMELQDQSRNSIVVMPTRALAATKAVGSILYFGSEFQGKRADIIEHMKERLKNGNATQKVKACMVADTFNKYFWNNEDFFKSNFHIVIDEADMYQSESGYRPSLDETMEIYLEFPKKQRTLISATLQEYGIQELKNEVLHTIEVVNMQPYKLQVVESRGVFEADLASLIKEVIQKHTNCKIIVAYNYIKGINQVIAMLGSHSSDINILCSEESHHKIPKNYILEEFNGTLQKKITFFTSAYFAGIDVMEDAVVIVASNIDKPFKIISSNKTLQIFGRPRPKKTTDRYFIGTLDKNISAEVRKLNKSYLREAKSNLKIVKQSLFYKKGLDKDNLKEVIQKFTIAGTNCLRLGRGDTPKINYLALDYLGQIQKSKNELHCHPNKIKSSFKSFQQILVNNKIIIKDESEPVEYKKAYASIKKNSIQPLINYLKYASRHILNKENKTSEFYSLAVAPPGSDKEMDKIKEMKKYYFCIGGARIDILQKYVIFQLDTKTSFKQKLTEVVTRLSLLRVWESSELATKLQWEFQMNKTYSKINIHNKLTRLHTYLKSYYPSNVEFKESRYLYHLNKLFITKKLPNGTSQIKRARTIDDYESEMVLSLGKSNPQDK